MNTQHTTAGGNDVLQQEWEIVYEGIQRSVAETPIAASRFGLSIDGVRITG